VTSSDPSRNARLTLETGSTRAARGDHRLLAYGALLIAVLGISWSAIFIRWAAVPGPSSAFYRVLIAALVLVPLWLASLAGKARRTTPIREGRMRAAWLALLGGAFFGLDLALYNTAVMRTTAAEATLFGNNAPLFVGLGTWLIFLRRPKRSYWTGLALATMGGATIMVAAIAGHATAAHISAICLR
jgi:drug/metabolite transporter (DMT)-like permease